MRLDFVWLLCLSLTPVFFMVCPSEMAAAEFSGYWIFCIDAAFQTK